MENRKVPPYSIEAERLILTVCLLDPELLTEVTGKLKSDDFYRADHRAVYRAIASVFMAGEEVDVITVADKMKDSGSFSEVGGFDFLSGLVDVAPTRAIDEYITIVREKASLRRLILAAELSIQDAYGAGDRDVRQILDAAEARALAVGGDVGMQTSSWVADSIMGVMERIEEHDGSVPLGVQTGFYDIDRMTSGLQRGDLIIIAARPSMGKTTLAGNIAVNVGINGGVAAIFSLESSQEALLRRFIFSESRVPIDHWRRGEMSREEYARLGAGAGRVSQASLWIDDQPSSTVMEIKAKARRVLAQRGKLDLVIIDYIQLIGSRGGTKDMSREQEVGQISRQLKAMAKELNVPVVALSQLSRAPEKREDKRPVLSDLRDSGSIEQDADVVMFLYRGEYYTPTEALKGKAELLFRKQRDGATGDVLLYFNAEYTRFDSLEREGK